MPAIQQSGLDVVVTIQNVLLPPQGPASLNGLVGQPAIVATYTAVGGQAPYAWSIQSGTLPPGSTTAISPDTSQFTITIPTTAAGSWGFRVGVSCGA